MFWGTYQPPGNWELGNLGLPTTNYLAVAARRIDAVVAPARNPGSLKE